MTRTLAFVLLAAASSASAQVFMTEPVSMGHGAWMFDLGAQMGRPVGAFQSNVDRAWGGGFGVRHHFGWLKSLGLRGDVSWLNYGNERKSVPLSPTVNRVLVDMHTSNNIAVFSGGPELMLMNGPAHPYAFAFAGYSLFYTESSAGDDNGSGTFASTTNFWDGGLATGWGGGVRIPFHARSTDAAFDAGARFTRNGARSYLIAGDITDQPDGSLAFNERRTTADFWQYHVGVSFSPRRR